MSGWRSTFESLAAPQFRRIFMSNLAFFLAMGGQGIVRPWLAFQLTDSALALGLVSAAVALPMLFLAPFGGVLADRMERRRLIMTAQALAISSEVIILVLLLTDRLEFWHLVMTAAMMGCAFPVIMPARQAIVVNIVGKRGLGAAVALNMAGGERDTGPRTGHRGIHDSHHRSEGRLHDESFTLHGRSIDDARCSACPASC